MKVWEQRAYRDYDDTQELGTRNIKVALRRLRKFAREGPVEELDLPDTCPLYTSEVADDLTSLRSARAPATSKPLTSDVTFQRTDLLIL